MHIGPVSALNDGGWTLRADEGTVCHLIPGLADVGLSTWPLAKLARRAPDDWPTAYVGT
jgi:hypothetical protein